MAANGNGSKRTFESIMLHKPPPLEIEHAKVPTDSVVFDPENPRLKYLKEQFPDKSDKELLFDHPDTPWLKKDIAEKGVLEPIYVRTKPHGTYMATEGNRRTAVMQELLKEAREKGDQAKIEMYSVIPARLLPEHTTPVQEALLMASFHVAGRIHWDAHERAGHIHNMLRVLHIPELELQNTLHMGVPAIKRAAESFDLLERFKTIDGGKYAPQVREGRWSFFAEFLKVKEFRERHHKSQDFGDTFCHWVGEGRVPKAEDVRTLNKILRNARARTVFENEPAKEAFEKANKEVDKTNPGGASKFFAQIEKTIEAIKRADFEDIQMAIHNETARDIVIEAHQRLETFMNQAQVIRRPRSVA